MTEHPPPRLVKLLEGLRLATPAQVAGLAGRARRLARGLPLVESVWVDALAQVRLLTAWQAGQINAGRGDGLRVGPFVLGQPLQWPDFGAAYRAREIGGTKEYRLLILPSGGVRSDPLLRLEALAARAPEMASAGISPIVRAGADGALRYAASEWVEGRSAAEWMIHHGRFSPTVVLEIARQMAAALQALEKAGLCHGDLSPRGMLLTDAGQVVLVGPGLRGIVRPEEGAGHADLRPEAYDYLAPERVAGGSGPTPASDRYACGCLWWHLLAGRPPLAGGSSLAKLQAARAGRLANLAELVYDVPGPLAEAIAGCTACEPSERPDSFGRLVARLGPADRDGRAALRRCLGGQEWTAGGFDPFSSRAGPSRQRGIWPVVTAVLLAMVAAAIGLVWLVATPLVRGKAEPGAVATAASSPIRAEKPPGEATGVVRAAHVAPATEAGQAKPIDVIADGPLACESIRLAAGARVSAAQGKRVQISVPADGWLVPVEDVCFENVDFHCQASGAAGGAIVRLQAHRAEFRGCTFRAPERSAGPVAVRWIHPADRARAVLALPSGRLRLSDCVFQAVEAVVECRTQGAVAVEFSNCLQLEGGPLVRTPRCPGAEESLRITLVRTTLRGGGPLLECRYEAIPGSLGPVAIQAHESALFPRAGGALLAMVGAEDPRRLMEAVEWTGQGSLMASQAAVAVWTTADGRTNAVDDARLAISGVVRSEVEFAGPVGGRAESSRIIGWQGPLRSVDPPGVDPARLPAVSQSGKRI